MLHMPTSLREMLCEGGKKARRLHRHWERKPEAMAAGSPPKLNNRFLLLFFFFWIPSQCLMLKNRKLPLKIFFIQGRKGMHTDRMKEGSWQIMLYSQDNFHKQQKLLGIQHIMVKLSLLHFRFFIVTLASSKSPVKSQDTSGCIIIFPH